MTPYVQLENVTLDFPIFDHLTRSAKAQLAKSASLSKKNQMKFFKALDEVTVELRSGDRVGLLGDNGAGKSTFLKTLAGIYSPTSGKIDHFGEISSLFNVSVGLDANASGYDNIPLLMAARKIPLSFTDEITREVEEFSGIGDALLRPVRTYSAGMRLRLAFAVATAKSSQILLLDEVVGVGDENFRKQSNERIQQLMKEAGIMVVASHSNGFLATHCNRGLVFQKGQIIFDGKIEDAIEFRKTNRGIHTTLRYKSQS